VVSAAWILAGALLWGGFGSLVCRRVVTAVPVIGFWWVMTMLVPMIWIPWMLGLTATDEAVTRWPTILLALSYVAIGAADVVLGYGWCRGRYFDGLWIDEWNHWASHQLHRLTGWRRVRSRLPKRGEPDSAAARTWQRLIWHERHRESYHRSLLYLGCLLAAVMGSLHSVSGSSLLPIVFPLLIVLPLTLGVLGFRHEGQGAAEEFLVHRGISPCLIWLAKQAVWLPRSLWLPLVILAVGCLFDAMLAPPRGNSLLLSQLFRERQVASILFWFAVLGCASGQLTALLLRRVILSIALGTLLNLVMVLWLAVMVSLRVPLWWSVGGVVVLLLLNTLLLMPMRYSGAASRVRPIPWFAVNGAVLALLMGAIGLWRVNEVGGDPSAWTSTFRNESDMPLPISREEEHLLDVLARTRTGFNAEADFLAGAAGDRELAGDQFWSSNAERLTMLSDAVRAASGFGRIPAQAMRSTSSQPPLQVHQQLLLEAARLKLERGELEAARDYVEVNQRLAALWARGGGVVSYEEGIRQQMQGQSLLIRWAQHPAQTAESVRSVLEQLQQEAEVFPSMFEVILGQYREDRDEMDRVITAGIPGLSRPFRMDAWQMALMEIARFLPWERERAEQLLVTRMARGVTLTQSVASILPRPGADPTEIPRLLAMSLPDQGPLWETTPLLWFGPGPNEQAVIQRGLERENALRQAQISLALVVWKLEHNQWPASLGDLLTQSPVPFPPQTVIDPFSGDQFHYTSPDTNPPEEGSLVLWSVGPLHLRQVYTQQPDGVALRITSSGGDEALGGAHWSSRTEVTPEGLRLRPALNAIFPRAW